MHQRIRSRRPDSMERDVRMLNRALLSSRSLTLLAESEDSLKDSVISSSEWDILGAISENVMQFQRATLFLSAFRYPTILPVFLIWHNLGLHWQNILRVLISMPVFDQ